MLRKKTFLTILTLSLFIVLRSVLAMADYREIRLYKTDPGSKAHGYIFIEPVGFIPTERLLHVNVYSLLPNTLYDVWIVDRDTGKRTPAGFQGQNSFRTNYGGAGHFTDRSSEFILGWNKLEISEHSIADNLIFYERFNETLGAWTLDRSGGTAAIVKKDYSQKLQLKDTASTRAVSATRSFAEPSGKWILEYDINYAPGARGIAELLDTENNIIATVDCGKKANTVHFSTDTAGVSTSAFSAGLYKQVILVVDNVANTIKAYVSEDDNTFGSLRQVGPSRGYSGKAIAKVRFSSGPGAKGIVYVDEVKVYTPDIFIIGDSITDGKPYWSTHPGFNNPDYGVGRLRSTVDETSSPGYQLSRKLGASIWVANRAFGGAMLADIDEKIQTALLDHNPKRVYIAVGRNDMASTPLSSMRSSLDSIINKVQSAGITGQNILLANTISANGPDPKLRQWNSWVRDKALKTGAVFVDLDSRMKDPAHPGYGNPAYLERILLNGGVHFNRAGSAAIAGAIEEALSPKVILWTWMYQ